MPLPMPVIQGTAHDYSSLDIKLDAISYIGIKSIDFTDELSPGKVYGTAAQKIAETRGQQDASGSFEMYKEYAAEFESSLISSHQGTGLYEIRFPIDIIIAPEGYGTQTSIKIVGARITKRTFSASSGNDPITYKYDFTAMYIIVDGVETTTGLRK